MKYASPGDSGMIYGKFTTAQGIVLKDYNLLSNKPLINGTELVGDKTFAELGLIPMTSVQIDAIVNSLT